MAAINPDVSDAPVRVFGIFTHGLHDLEDWFTSHGGKNVAMESAGVYWISIYEILEQHGLKVILVNARHAAGVSATASTVGGISGGSYPAQAESPDGDQRVLSQSLASNGMHRLIERSYAESAANC